MARSSVLMKTSRKAGAISQEENNYPWNRARLCSQTLKFCIKTPLFEACQRLHTTLLVSIETSCIMDILCHKAQMTEQLVLESGPDADSLLASCPHLKLELWWVRIALLMWYVPFKIKKDLPSIIFSYRCKRGKVQLVSTLEKISQHALPRPQGSSLPPSLTCMHFLTQASKVHATSCALHLISIMSLIQQTGMIVVGCQDH